MMTTFYHGSHKIFDRFDLSHALGTNRAVLDDSKVKIVRIDSVNLDDRKKLIQDTITPVR